MVSSRLKILTTAFGWVVVFTAAVLFTKTLWANWEKLEGIQFRPDGFIMLALISTVLAVAVSGLAWGRIVEKLVQEKIPAKESVRIHFASWLLKYIPGQTGSLLNKLNWARNKGIDGKKVTASFIYENVFVAIASLVVSLPVISVSLGYKFSEDVGLFIPILVAVPFIIVVIIPKAFASLLNLAFKVLKKKTLNHDELLSVRDVLRFLVWFIVPRLINGFAFVLMAISVIGIPPSQYLVFGAIYVLAGIIGILAVFVPSGLGVREAVVTLFATAYIPVEQAVALALIARFYATVADVLVFGWYLHLKQGSKVSL